MMEQKEDECQYRRRMGNAAVEGGGWCWRMTSDSGIEGGGTEGGGAVQQKEKE
jgi:hypothetical protein